MTKNIVSRPRGASKWTPEIDRELYNLWNDGVHKSEIAERLGMTISAVEGRYHRIKKEQTK